MTEKAIKYYWVIKWLYSQNLNHVFYHLPQLVVFSWPCPLHVFTRRLPWTGQALNRPSAGTVQVRYSSVSARYRHGTVPVQARYRCGTGTVQVQVQVQQAIVRASYRHNQCTIQTLSWHRQGTVHCTVYRHQPGTVLTCCTNWPNMGNALVCTRSLILK